MFNKLSDMEKIIELENIYAGYDGESVLRDVSFCIYENDFLGVIGPNGGGKTTLVQVVLGLLKPQKGQIKYFRGGLQTDSLRVGYLPQYNTFDTKFPISVRDVVLSGLQSHKNVLFRFSKSDKQQVSEILNMMGLKGVENHAIGELSGGQRQRVLIARALMCQPEILILDEPNTYIDRQNQEKLYDLLNRINKNCAIILVSHDVGTVLQIVRNIVCINNTAHYHAATEVDAHLLESVFGCPFEMVAHGHFPHRVLENH